jgi:hypothetical protein
MPHWRLTLFLVVACSEPCARRAPPHTVSDLLARPHGRRAALTAYEAERDKECTKYLFERAHYYASEQRFSTPFWQRRQVMRRLPNEMTSRPPAMAGAEV